MKGQHSQLQSQRARDQAECYVSEYLGIDQKVPVNMAQNAVGRSQAPRTFQMEKLLNELKQIDTLNSCSSSSSNNSSSNMSNNTSGIIGNRKQNNASMNNPSSWASNAHSLFNGNMGCDSLSNEWSQEYWSSMLIKQSPMIIDDRAFKWSADYLTQNEATVFDETWGNLMLQNSNISNNHFMFNNNLTNAITSNASHPSLPTTTTTTTTTNNNQLNEEMRKTANELLDSMQDSRFSESEVVVYLGYQR